MENVITSSTFLRQLLSRQKTSHISMSKAWTGSEIAALTVGTLTLGTIFGVILATTSVYLEEVRSDRRAPLGSPADSLQSLVWENYVGLRWRNTGTIVDVSDPRQLRPQPHIAAGLGFLPRRIFRLNVPALDWLLDYGPW